VFHNFFALSATSGAFLATSTQGTAFSNVSQPIAITTFQVTAKYKQAIQIY
jgi:hypothetical protein